MILNPHIAGDRVFAPFSIAMSGPWASQRGNVDRQLSKPAYLAIYEGMTCSAS
jgi:hypothetical protein